MLNNYNLTTMKFQISTGAPFSEIMEELKDDPRLTVLGKGKGDSVIIETDVISDIEEDYSAISEIIEYE